MGRRSWLQEAQCFSSSAQIVLDALALQMRGQRSPSARAGLILIARAGARRKIVVIFGILLRFCCGFGKLGTEFLGE